MYSKICKWHFIIGCIIVTGFCSCRQLDVFEKNATIPGYNWKADQPATGSFFISDTSARYNIYIVLRHTDAYQYNNIWLQIGWQAPGDTLYTQKIDLSLGSDAGGWEGAGMNDIWEVRKLIRSDVLGRTGEYKFTISQLMRENPLPNVMSAGLRVEKQP